MLCEPLLTDRAEGGRRIPLLIWRLPRPLLAVSSAPLGGGIGVRRWVLNASVPMSYDRDDPGVHLREMAGQQGLTGPGVGLLTGVDVAEVVTAAEDGVQVWATVGLGAPGWAAAPPSAGGPLAGTINIIGYAPQRLHDAALVNAVATATEAKAQVLAELGLAGTGTPTDAVCVLCPADGPSAPYAGPRSRWGAPLARAVHRAVRDGAAAYLAAGVPWSHRPDR